MSRSAARSLHSEGWSFSTRSEARCLQLSGYREPARSASAAGDGLEHTLISRFPRPAGDLGLVTPLHARRARRNLPRRARIRCRKGLESRANARIPLVRCPVAASAFVRDVSARGCRDALERSGRASKAGGEADGDSAQGQRGARRASKRPSRHGTRTPVPARSHELLHALNDAGSTRRPHQRLGGTESEALGTRSRLAK